MKDEREIGKASADPVVPGLDDAPGVPGFRTWRGVYLFVFGFFVAVVIGLTILTHVYR